jgi:hypothetical protein
MPEQYDPWHIRPLDIETVRDEVRRELLWQRLLFPLELAIRAITWPMTRETRTQKVIRATGESFSGTIASLVGTEKPYPATATLDPFELAMGELVDHAERENARYRRSQSRLHTPRSD